MQKDPSASTKPTADIQDQERPGITRWDESCAKPASTSCPSFHVLKGDMSLVAPALADWITTASAKTGSAEIQRLLGITCRWQVNGRSSFPFEKWMELDMQYIDRWSLYLDFAICKDYTISVEGFGAA